MCTKNICMYIWVVVKKLGSFLGPSDNTAPNYSGYPKRDPNFDNHPNICALQNWDAGPPRRHPDRLSNASRWP